MFYSDIENIIKNYGAQGSKYGLSRTRKLLEAFGSPDKKLKIIHIAGTNGKGSIAAYITNILVASGYKTGTFTSPEVYSYYEKFLFDGRPAEDLTKYFLSEVYGFAQTLQDKPTAFEIETAAALAAFAATECEYAVIECGLGGRDDATNAISQKELAVISSVSLEHTAVLGDTVEQICGHKAGIINGCPAVVSALQTKEGRKYFEKYSPVFAGDGVKVTDKSLNGQTFEYKGESYFIRLLGGAQCYNAACAIEAAKIIGVGGCKIRTGLALTSLAGRNQIIKKGGTTYVLDGSHNPASFAPLCDLLKSVTGDKTLVFGCLSDKDVNAAAKILSQYFDKAVLLSPNSPRAMDLEKINRAFEGKIKEVSTAESVTQALQKAEGELIAVCGSFTLLKEAKEWIEKKR